METTSKRTKQVKRKRAGRPAADPKNPRSSKIQTRVSPAERDLVKACAARAGIKAGAWIHEAIAEKLSRLPAWFVREAKRGVKPKTRKAVKRGSS